MTRQPEAVADFIPAKNNDYEVFVARPDATAASDSDIDAIFGATSIEISEGTVDELEKDILVLFRDGEVVAVSPLREFSYIVDRITHRVGRTAEVSLTSLTLPSVLVELAGNTIDVTSSAKRSELLFTTISRCIESQAWKKRDGQLRVGIQNLSRMTEESRTRAVYEQLAETEVRTHVYGIPDAIPPTSLDLTIHGGWTDDFARNWFVIYRSPSLTTTAAFLAHERENGELRGHWTFDTDRVNQLATYLEKNL